MQLEYGEQRIAVAAADVVIGSDPNATVRLAGATVSGRHAVVKRLGDHLVAIQPLDPTATIKVNGTVVGRDPTPLLHGDRVGIGVHELKVVDPRRAGATRQLEAAAAPAPRAAPTEATAAGSGGRLVSLTDGREYRIDVAPFVFGREAGSAVVIASPDASRQHAEIVSRPDGDVLVDLSSNGTFVNGERVQARRELKALDVIRIGAEEFRYYPETPRREAPATPPAGAEYRLGDTLVGLPGMPSLRSGPPTPARAAPAPVLASLLVKRGERKGDRLPVRTPVAHLGRGEFNDVRFADPSISASHAKLQLREGVWVISDLGSTNGTFVDDLPVDEETALSPGCTVRLGEVALLFEPLDEGASKPVGTVVLPKAAAQAAERAAPRPAAAAPARAPARPFRAVWRGVAIVVLLAALAALVLLT